jgi:hypothetical protein
LSEWLSELSLQDRAQKLNRVSHNLTICAREFQLPPFAEDSRSAVKRLLGINELQHKISAQIGHYLHGEAIKVYPVEVFSEILFEIAAQYEILPMLKGAIQHAKTGSWHVPQNGVG